MDINTTGEAITAFHTQSIDIINLMAQKAKRGETNQMAWDEYATLKQFYEHTKKLIERMDLIAHSIRLEALRFNLENKALETELKRVYLALSEVSEAAAISVLKDVSKVDFEGLTDSERLKMKYGKIPISKELIKKAAERVKSGTNDVNRVFDFFTFTQEDLREYSNMI